MLVAQNTNQTAKHWKYGSNVGTRLQKNKHHYQWRCQHVGNLIWVGPEISQRRREYVMDCHQIHTSFLLTLLCLCLNFCLKWHCLSMHSVLTKFSCVWHLSFPKSQDGFRLKLWDTFDEFQTMYLSRFEWWCDIILLNNTLNCTNLYDLYLKLLQI
jgi:hypothetical protein